MLQKSSQRCFCWCLYSVMPHRKAFIYKKKSFYSLFTAGLIRVFIWRLVCCVFAFLHLGYQLWKNKKKGWGSGFWWLLLPQHAPPTFSGVENTVGLGVADVAAFGFAVMLKSADLAEVMLAPTAGRRRFPKPSVVFWSTVLMLQIKSVLLCHNGIFEGLLADEALEGQILLIAAHLVVLLVWKKAGRCSASAATRSLGKAETHCRLRICPPPAPAQSASHVCSPICREGTCSCLKKGHQNV